MMETFKGRIKLDFGREVSAEENIFEGVFKIHARRASRGYDCSIVNIRKEKIVKDRAVFHVSR